MDIVTFRSNGAESHWTCEVVAPAWENMKEAAEVEMKLVKNIGFSSASKFTEMIDGRDGDIRQSTDTVDMLLMHGEEKNDTELIASGHIVLNDFYKIMTGDCAELTSITFVVTEWR